MSKQDNDDLYEAIKRISDKHEFPFSDQQITFLVALLTAVVYTTNETKRVIFDLVLKTAAEFVLKDLNDAQDSLKKDIKKILN